MRLIDADELERKIAESKAQETMGLLTLERRFAYEWTKSDMYGLVKNAPTIEAEPVRHVGGIVTLPMRTISVAYIQQLEATNAELLTKVEQLEKKCHQLERERDAAVKCIGELAEILKDYPHSATNCCAYRAYCEVKQYMRNMRGVKEE